jgi:hypothetical protein
MYIWVFILILVHKTSLNPPLFIEVPVPCYDSSSHVFVYYMYPFCLFLRFCFMILELFWQYGILFHFSLFTEKIGYTSKC